VSGRKYELTLYETPPSLNAVGSRGRSHWLYTNTKKRLQGQLGVALMAAKVPRGLERVEATAVLRFKSKRRRDEGNYRALLEKALGDMLVTGGWLEDDTPECYSFGSLEFDPERGEPRTIIRLEVEFP
jgi:hypothetical protein